MTLYAKIVKGKIEKYPYSIDQLRHDNPTVSFPNDLKDLSPWNAFPVEIAELPKYDTKTHKVSDDTPSIEYANGKWIAHRKIVEKTDQEVVNEMQRLIENIKRERNRRLAETDWMGLSDYQMSDAWKQYRQDLRDITKQSEFPYNVQWPKTPE